MTSVDNHCKVQTHSDYQFHHYTRIQEAKIKRSRANARGRGRGQFFEAESEAEDKIMASRPACPRGLNTTDM